jgi:hypothetical protein
MLAADPRIVRTLEQVRSLVCSPEGDAKDLLKNDTHCQTTLGFRVAFGQVDCRPLSMSKFLILHHCELDCQPILACNCYSLVLFGSLQSTPHAWNTHNLSRAGSSQEGTHNLSRAGSSQGGECIISQVITGSALHMEGEALEGDVIMAVDGVHLAAVDQETAAELLRKNDKVGNKSILTLSRGGGAPFRVTVVHSSVAGVREMERLCYLLEDHAQVFLSSRRSARMHSVYGFASALFYLCLFEGV